MQRSVALVTQASRLADYAELTKPRITLMVVLTTAAGYYLGVDGPVTYPKNEPLRQALLAVGLERVVLETDSPYLPPQSSRGKRNDPGLLPEIAARLAVVFGTSPEEVARKTTANALALFRL